MVESTHVRIAKKTIKLLRLIRVETDERMIDILHRLIESEYNKLNSGEDTKDVRKDYRS